MREDDSTKVYILGGKTGDADTSESSAGKSFLMSLGINNRRIQIEEKSCHTLENLKNYFLLKGKNQTVSLITNRYHMARSIMMAKGFSINAIACPVEVEFQYNIVNISKIFVEGFYLHFYLVGKYFAKVTHNQRILNRISSTVCQTKTN